MNPHDRDSRAVHALKVRARWWPCNPLDARWLAGLRRAGLEPRELKRLRAAVTCDTAAHEFETQNFGALKNHWKLVYGALGRAARDRWRALALALRIADAPRAGPEDAWLRGTMADFQTPVADAERNYHRLRTVRCEWYIDAGRLVVPYALVREDPVVRRHILLSLCVMETTATTHGAIEALGGLVCAPRALSVVPRAPAHNQPPDPAPHRALVVPIADADDEGTECIPRIGRIVEVVPSDVTPPRAPPVLVLQDGPDADAYGIPATPPGWGVGDGAFAFGLAATEGGGQWQSEGLALTPRAPDPFGLAVPATPGDAQFTPFGGELRVQEADAQWDEWMLGLL